MLHALSERYCPQDVGQLNYRLKYFVFTARKTIFSFSKCSEKMVFPKKSNWNMIFLVLSGKMIFLFPEDRQKRKDDLSQKNTWNMFSSNMMVFTKKSHKIMNIFVTSGKMVFLFSLDGKSNYLSAKKKQRQIHLKVTFAASLKKMIFILENMVFLLKYHVD